MALISFCTVRADPLALTITQTFVFDELAEKSKKVGET